MSVWAKKDREGRTLPLAEHMLDVAATFEALIREPHYRRALEAAAGQPIDPVTEARLCVLAGLHDIGKANRAFQAGEGGHLADGYRRISAGRLRDVLLKWRAREDDHFILNICTSLFSHHGEIIKNPGRGLPQPDMDRAAADAFEALLRAWPASLDEGALPAFPPVFFHLLAGLLTIADQVGSSERRFPIVRGPRFRRDGAAAIRATGLESAAAFRLSPEMDVGAFGWPAGARASAMQQAVADLPLSDRLVLIESETGSGKTEAALLRFDRLLRAGAVGALYFAVPTRSAASQIQGRVSRAGRALWGAEATLAVPGYIRVGADDGVRRGPFDVTWGDEGRVVEERWSADAPRKFLAAPLAVGTVDQALAAVVRRKWAHMRAAALSRALLVIDEVHASDSYMMTHLENLLHLHLSLGGHALLMSATFATHARDRLFRACGAAARPEASPYPALTSLRQGRQEIIAVAPGTAKEVRVEARSILQDSERIAAQAAELVGKGARVLVIRNSVKAATDVLDALRADHPEAPVMTVSGRAAVHHSRFAPEDRRLLDVAVEGAMGRASQDPVIVIGTQTLEQSLDIDADILLTDICPIDVLLQRIGRLHRHARPRPAGFEAPRCLVLDAPGAPNLRAFGIGSERAYPAVRTIVETRALLARGTWTIPADNRELVDRGAAREFLDEDPEARARETRGTARADFAGLDYQLPISDSPAFSPAHGTRDGSNDLAVRLSQPMAAAFAPAPINEMKIPAWMLGEKAANRDWDEVAVVTGDEKFSFAGNTFIYDERGLRQIFS